MTRLSLASDMYDSLLHNLTVKNVELQSAHMALIDALMMGYAHQVVTLENVVQSVR